MGDCNRCSLPIVEADSIKCDGICNKVYHLACAGPGKGISKTFYNTCQDNDYFLFLCTLCRNTKMKFVNETLGKILNMLVITDERLNRQNAEVVKINENYEEMKNLALKSETDVKELKNSIEKLEKVIKEDAQEIGVQMKEIKNSECSNNEKILMVCNEVKVAMKNNEEDIRTGIYKKNSKVGKRASTFADKVREMNNEPVVMITPKIAQDNKKTKDVLKTMIDSSTIQMNHAGDLAKGGLAIACSSTAASKELQERVAEKMGDDYEVKLTELKKPKVKIVGMSEELTSEEIVTKLKAQNEFLKDSNIVVSHMHKGLKGFFTAVIEVDGKIFSKLLEIGRVFIDFDICRVLEDLQVMRCYNCAQFFHKGKDCTKKKACQRCGEDHGLSNCTSEVVKCVNCMVAVATYNLKLDINYPSYDKNCTMYKQKLKIARRRISYNQ